MYSKSSFIVSSFTSAVGAILLNANMLAALIFDLANANANGIAINTMLCSVCQKWIAKFAWFCIVHTSPKHISIEHAEAHVASLRFCVEIWIQRQWRQYLLSHIWSENLLSFECCYFTGDVISFHFVSVWFGLVRLGSCLWVDAL